MAQNQSRQQEESEVTPAPEDSGASTRQVGPASDRKQADLKADMTYPQDAEKGALKEPEHDADKTPYPVQEQPPIERPPYSTGRPDVPIVRSAILGAGEHTPPDPAQFKPDGRPRLDGVNE